MKPNARVPSVAREGEGYLVAVREPARENAANEAVRRALAAHFDVAPSRVRLLRGATSKIKTFEVDVERVR